MYFCSHIIFGKVHVRAKLLIKKKHKKNPQSVPSCFFNILSCVLFDPLGPSLTSKRLLLLCSVETVPWGVVLVAIPKEVVEVETVPCGVVLVVVRVEVVEVKTVPC